MWTDSLPQGSKPSSSVPSGKGQQSISWAAIPLQSLLQTEIIKLLSALSCQSFLSLRSYLFECFRASHLHLFWSLTTVSFQAVWPACLGRAGKGIQAEWENGHEAADLRTQELEQFYLFETGRVRRATALCFAYLYPNATDGHVDGAPENEEDLLVKGTFTCFTELSISFVWRSVLLGSFFPLFQKNIFRKPVNSIDSWRWAETWQLLCLLWPQFLLKSGIIVPALSHHKDILT